jgi:hypothetical protein
LSGSERERTTRELFNKFGQNELTQGAQVRGTFKKFRSQSGVRARMQGKYAFVAMQRKLNPLWREFDQSRQSKSAK